MAFGKVVNNPRVELTLSKTEFEDILEALDESAVSRHVDRGFDDKSCKFRTLFNHLEELTLEF